MEENMLWNQCFYELKQNIRNTESEIYHKYFSDLVYMRKHDKFVIPRIELVATTKCTLKCSGCSHLMDQYKEQRHMPFDLIIENLFKFLNGVDKCVCIGITGGEPFLYPQLAQLIEICIEHPKILFIDVTTNGTMLPKVKEIKVMAQKNLTIKISKYVESNKFEKLKSLFDDNLVNYTIVDRDWFEYGGFHFRNKKNAKMRYDFISCYEAFYCKTLILDKFFHCPRAAFMKDSGLIDIDNQCIHVDDIVSNNKILIDFYHHKRNETCNYCDRMNKNYIEAGRQCNE